MACLHCRQPILRRGPQSKFCCIACNFWHYVPEPDAAGHCIWCGPVIRGHGPIYGRVNCNYAFMPAHVACLIIHGIVIPKGMMGLHRCNVGLCVALEHLYVGTCSDNARDSWKTARKTRSGRTWLPSHFFL